MKPDCEVWKPEDNCRFAKDTLRLIFDFQEQIKGADGRETIQDNLERPALLFDEAGNPTHLFCASGDGAHPYDIEENSSVLCMWQVTRKEKKSEKKSMDWGMCFRDGVMYGSLQLR